MKALVWTNPGQFEARTLDDPVATQGEVVIRVRHSGICGSDLSGYLGENSLRRPPLIMGHEFAGEIVEVGPSVHNLVVGDVVTVNPLIACGTCSVCRRGMPQYCTQKQIIGIHRPGAFAEYVVTPATTCRPVSDTVSGSLVEPLACSIRAARQAGLDLGDNVVVFGAGIIGLFALQAAALLGANKRILIDTNDHRLSHGSLFGATDTINAQEVDVVRAVADIAGGQVECVIDAVGLALTRRQSIHMTAPGGRVVWIGLHEDSTHVPGNLIVRSEIGVVGSFCCSDDDFQTAHALIERKIVTPRDEWLDIRPLDTVKQCFDEQINGPARFPKLVLTV